jgi:glutathione S-transferase
MLTVHGMSASGNCHKVRMLLEYLRQPYRWIETDTMKGMTRTPEFLARNPNGKVPLLEIEPGRYLAESNAILCYLADGTDMLPEDRYQRALALQWMFFEQYSHEPYIAVARYIALFLPEDDARRADLPRLRDRGQQALKVMEGHLEGADWFAGGRYSVADIALFAYTHAAAGGGFDLAGYPALRRWLDRVRAEPGASDMPSP